MPAGSSKKRERQYEHVKESAERRGESPAPGEGDRRADGELGARPLRRGEDFQQDLHA